nr:uncharacterized protein LOC129444234 [Misgurnus anguillicaudatus]
MKVKPGDNITLHCDRPLTRGLGIMWIKNSSYEFQPSLMIDYRKMNKETISRFSFPKNSNISSFDLHITNITVFDLGLHYCAEYEKKFKDDEKGMYLFEVYYYGNQTTRLSLAVTSCSADFNNTVSPPPVSDCILSWMLLVSVCVVCFLICFICVYCFCKRKTTGLESAKMLTANVMKMDSTEKHQCLMSKTGKVCLHTEVTYRLLPSVHR